MALIRTKPRHKKIIKLMTEGDAKYVSLVDHGAIQRPFHAVKSIAKEAPMSKKKAPAVKVNRIVFDAAHFTDEEAVKSFLTAKGYSGFTIKAVDGGGFEVEDTPATDLMDDIREVPSTETKGVTYFAGTPKAEEADKAADNPAQGDDAGAGVADTTEGAEGAEGAAKGADEGKPADAADTAQAPVEEVTTADTAKAAVTPEPRKRSRKAAALMVGGLSVNAIVAKAEAFTELASEKGLTAKGYADAVQEYTGSMPPGLWSLNDALNSELRRLLRHGKADEAHLTALTSEYVRAVITLTAAYQSIIDGSVSDVAKGATPEELSEIDRFLDALFGAPGAADATAELVVTDDGTAQKLDDVLKSLAALQAGQDRLLGVVDSVAIAALEADQVAAKAAVIVEEPERVVPGRKSAEEADEDVTDPVDDEETKETQRRAAKRLGFVQ